MKIEWIDSAIKFGCEKYIEKQYKNRRPCSSWNSYQMTYERSKIGKYLPNCFLMFFNDFHETVFWR